MKSKFSKGFRRPNNSTRRRNKKQSRFAPPPHDATMNLVTETYRFQASAAMVNDTVTLADLFNEVCVALTATTSARLCDAVLLREIEMWGPPPATGTTSTCSVQFTYMATGPGNPSRIVSDTSMGADRCSHIKTKPPFKGTSRLWLNPTDDVVLVISGPIGTIIDLKLSQIVQAGDGGPVSAGTLVSATPGKIYRRPLDLISGTGVILPLGYPSI